MTLIQVRRKKTTHTGFPLVLETGDYKYSGGFCRADFDFKKEKVCDWEISGESIGFPLHAAISYRKFITNSLGSVISSMA